MEMMPSFHGMTSGTVNGLNEASAGVHRAGKYYVLYPVVEDNRNHGCEVSYITSGGASSACHWYPDEVPTGNT